MKNQFMHVAVVVVATLTTCARATESPPAGEQSPLHQLGRELRRLLHQIEAADCEESIRLCRKAETLFGLHMDRVLCTYYVLSAVDTCGSTPLVTKMSQRLSDMHVEEALPVMARTVLCGKLSIDPDAFPYPNTPFCSVYEDCIVEYGGSALEHTDLLIATSRKRLSERQVARLARVYRRVYRKYDAAVTSKIATRRIERHLGSKWCSRYAVPNAKLLDKVLRADQHLHESGVRHGSTKEVPLTRVASRRKRSHKEGPGGLLGSLGLLDLLRSELASQAQSHLDMHLEAGSQVEKSRAYLGLLRGIGAREAIPYYLEVAFRDFDLGGGEPIPFTALHSYGESVLPYFFERLRDETRPFSDDEASVGAQILKEVLGHEAGDIALAREYLSAESDNSESTAHACKAIQERL